jgi:adenosylcobinamide kinase/adenosylcobinamide-phosphate guanylyltransferase
MANTKKFIFVTGGSRSGKSRYAVELAQSISDHVVFLATCVPDDEEMRARVEQHRKARPGHWRAIEEGKELRMTLVQLEGACDAVILDCVTLFVSNLLLENLAEDVILKKIEEIAEVARQVNYHTIIVSNEVGAGLVPETRLGRTFRDVVGRANQILAQSADEAYLIVSGIPIKLKG